MEQIGIVHKQLPKVLNAYYETNSPKPAFMLWGAMGIGKSVGVRDFAKAKASKKNKEFIEWKKVSYEKKLEMMENPDKYFVLHDERASQLEPSDLKGLPRFDANDAIEWKPPLWLAYFTKEKADGIIFFDEFNLAPPSVQASCYELLYDRTICERKLSDNILLIAAGNRSEDRANVFEMSAPLANRYGHYTLQPPAFSEWKEWAFKNNINNDIIAYLEYQPDNLFMFDHKSKSKAFPTPRTWEFASRLMDKLKEDDYDGIELMACGVLGEGTGREFSSFLRLRTNINIPHLLDHPQEVRNMELSMRYSLMSALGNHYKQNKKDLDKVLVLGTHLNPEFTTVLVKFLISPRVRAQIDLAKSKIWTEKYGQFAKFLPKKEM